MGRVYGDDEGYAHNGIRKQHSSLYHGDLYMYKTYTKLLVNSTYFSVLL